MSLKWYKNDESTEDICTIVESETTFNFDVFYAEGETDLDIILCYNMIIGGDSYLTKIKIECDEWDATNPLDLYNFIGGCLDKFYGEESTTDERGKFNEEIYSIVKEFCNENDIIIINLFPRKEKHNT